MWNLLEYAGLALAAVLILWLIWRHRHSKKVRIKWTVSNVRLK